MPRLHEEVRKARARESAPSAVSHPLPGQETARAGGSHGGPVRAARAGRAACPASMPGMRCAGAAILLSLHARRPSSCATGTGWLWASPGHSAGLHTSIGATRSAKLSNIAWPAEGPICPWPPSPAGGASKVPPLRLRLAETSASQALCRAGPASTMGASPRCGRIRMAVATEGVSSAHLPRHVPSSRSTKPRRLSLGLAPQCKQVMAPPMHTWTPVCSR